MALAHEQLATRSSAPPGRRPATILTVCGWELRRLLASRTTPALALQQQQPDLWPWVGPHAVLVLAGILAAALAAAAFDRFRGVLA